MIIIGSGQLFSFKYPAFDLDTNLFVQANIYDISTGVPNFVTQVAMTDVANGYYIGTYTGLPIKSYLVISVVYTDGTYSVVDTERAPDSDCYKSVDAALSFAAFEYGAYDLDDSLSVAGSVYDVTTGTPVFVSKLPMNNVFGGVYFASFSGTIDHIYEVAKIVYIDGTYMTVDTGRSPGSETIGLFQSVAAIIYTFKEATLIGQSIGARQLSGQLLVAKLKAGPCS